MKIIEPYAEIICHTPHPLQVIELVGRTCYKSADKITETSAAPFVANLVKHGHEAMLEHASVTVKFVVDRGVSHEIVRHRVASFAQESTRYCNYSKDGFGNEITVISPSALNFSELSYIRWKQSCETAERIYLQLLEAGQSPQEARSVLPNSLKTEIIMTANMREWRHFFKLRACDATGKAHPQIKQVAIPLLKQFQRNFPAIFDDLLPKE